VELFSLDNLLTLAMLTLLQAVLGFDNLLYISLESKRAPVEKQAFVRRIGIALTDVFLVMATAIIIGALLMIWLSDGVAEFLEKNRMYEVLGLFILLVVGIMLLSEGGHLAHLTLFDNAITPMTKTTFYFVIVVLVLTDVVQSRYRKKLLGQRAAVTPAQI